MDASPHGANAAQNAQYQFLRDRLSAVPVSSLIAAVMARGAVAQPEVIGIFASQLAHHGSDGARKEPLTSDPVLIQSLIELARGWAERLIASSASRRHQLADVATLMGRIGRPELVPNLKALLDEDLRRWRRVRAEFLAAPGRADIELRSDVAHSWTLQYREAFSRIGGDAVVGVVRNYLTDEEFGFDAACVLKAIWDHAHVADEPNALRSWPEFSGGWGAAQRESERAAGRRYRFCGHDPWSNPRLGSARFYGRAAAPGHHAWPDRVQPAAR
jgi:hypothetical protein